MDGLAMTEATSTQCRFCGASNRDTARFCIHCGAALEASVSVLQPGHTMYNGQYRIVRQLETGGMGTIYLAANTHAFGRLCVIKEMLAYYQPGEDARARARFQEEAKTLAALRHPGVPDMYGFFSENGHHYIVMEYIEGENLAAGLARNKSSNRVSIAPARDQADIVRYGIQICRVLEYLANIRPTPVVHNDIKPANIIIDKHGGQAVLVDFGTASSRYAPGAGGQPGTQLSSAYGTVGYAAPELYNGHAEPRSDVYALAATIYHLLTNDDPRDHPFKFPKLPELPAGLRALLQKALAAAVDDRSTATEFRQQLESFRAAHAGSVQPIQFPNGDQATTLTGLLDLSARHWAYARDILYDGSLENWLRTTLHDPVTANLVRDTILQYSNDPDAGLDHFLRTLNPHLGPARLRVLERRLDFGHVEPGATATRTLSIVNTGYGGAHGTVKSSAPWLQPASRDFGCGPSGRCDIAIRVVDTGVLSPGRHTGKIRLEPAAGPPIEVEAGVSIRRRSRSRPAPRVFPPRRRRRRAWFPNLWVLIFLLWLLSKVLGSCFADIDPRSMPHPDLDYGQAVTRLVVEPEVADVAQWLQDQLPAEGDSVAGIQAEASRLLINITAELQGGNRARKLVQSDLPRCLNLVPDGVCASR
jgi:serine/threonine protein kinase